MKGRVLVFTLAVAALLAVASPAAGGISISVIRYNPPGADTRKNLNGEYVMLKNGGGAAISLRGWTLTDRQGNRYRFGRLRLQGWSVVIVYTGRGTNTAFAVYWRRSSHVWNNRGDRATLRRASGVLVDRCSYRGSRSGTKHC